MNPETKTCQNCKTKFVIEPDDFAFYGKIQVPPPTWCPECRMVRRFLWRNERALYHRNCDLCKKSIIADFSPEAKAVVYCHECWWSDNWDPLTFGVTYDFFRPFFEQYRDLLQQTP